MSLDLPRDVAQERALKQKAFAQVMQKAESYTAMFAEPFMRDLGIGATEKEIREAVKTARLTAAIMLEECGLIQDFTTLITEDQDADSGIATA